DRLRAQIAWVRYVRARFGAQAEVASEEVRKKQEEIQKVKDLKQYEVCEIFIRAANPQEMAAAKARANVLYHQLSSGAPFRALAHEASDSISRNNGGYLGWMTHGQWNPALQSAVETIQPGAFSSPVEATGGIYILYLASVKQAGEAAPSRKAVSYLEARVPVTQNSTPEQIEKYLPVVEALKSAKGVKAFEDAAKAAGVVVTRHDKVSLDAINGYIQSHLNGAKGVIIDPPAMTPDGLYMAMISSIEDIKAELPKDDDVKAHLEQERLMKFSVREMARLDAGVFKEILIPTPKDIL
ncbi:MAG TPA: peptidylprolyl isomerase, partial [Alphaproteobacteria bacterium]|nr:peptidylprolyl isomerase [Alphaproteobacteria bacterium]